MLLKKNLRDQVRDYLLSEMVTGNLKTGKTINLAALARHLKVSVTPIREALTQLQQSHIIKAVPNRGFIIAELDVEEAEDLYELVANLEVMAIENSEFTEAHIVELKKQQEVFENATDAISRIQADLEFHRLLTKNYKNN
ncbi:GntR family transcriptional regulator, partial [Maribacter sp.]